MRKSYFFLREYAPLNVCFVHRQLVIRTAAANGDKSVIVRVCRRIIQTVTVSYTHLDVYKRQVFTLHTSFAPGLVNAAVIVDCAPSFNRVRQPGVAADDAVVADVCVAAENGCVCIDNHIIADIGMAFDILDRISVFIQFKALGAPVSYTHLDVYKRQHFAARRQKRARCISRRC